MKKMDNFLNRLQVLKQADFDFAAKNEIYRTGVVGQFNLTFELAWKALQQVLRVHGVQEAETGSPREILQLGYKVGFLENPSVWLLMLKKTLFPMTLCMRILLLLYSSFHRHIQTLMV